MHIEQGTSHMEVLSAIRGRLRLQFETAVASDEPFRRVPGVLSCRYNPRIRTLLCEYDPDAISEEKLIVRLGAAYAAQTDAGLLHIKHCEDKGFSLSPSGYLALFFIGLDGALSLTGSALTQFTRWLSTGATLAAVVEHGYQELHVRGSLLAWIITFGRHLIPRAPREQPYLIKRGKDQLTLTPMAGSESELAFAGSMFRQGMEMMAHKG